MMCNAKPVALTSRVFVVFASTVFGAISIASAEPVLCAFNGHYYEAVDDALSWSDAKAAAEAREVAGVSGHLAVITSQAENDCICALYPEHNALQAWIGGSQPGADWTWVTGEPWIVANEQWCPGEPNGGITENFLGFYSGADANHFCCWNDEDSGPTQYIVEYETGGIPTVSQWGIVAMSLLVLTAGTLVLVHHWHSSSVRTV